MLSQARPAGHARGLATGFGGSLIAAAVVFAAFVVAAIARVACGPIASIGGVAAVIVSVALCVMAWKAPPRLVVATAIGAVFALVPLVLMGTHVALSMPLATTHVRCGTGDVGLPLFAVVLIFTGSVVTFPLAALATSKTAALHRVLLVMCPAAVVVAVVTTALGLASLRKPDPDAFLQAFDQMTLEPGGSLTFGGTTLSYDTTVHPARLLGERTCIVHISRASDQSTDERIDTVGETCPRLRLYHHPVADLFVGTDFDEPSITRMVVGGATTIAFMPEVEVTIHDLRGSLGAPRGWVYGGAAGLLLSLLAMAAWYRARSGMVRVLSTSIDADHNGAGWIVGGSGPRFVPELTTASPGPVLVRDHDTRPPTYRADGAPASISVIEGTRASLRARMELHGVAWACIVVAIAVMTSAPLWIARLNGLL